MKNKRIAMTIVAGMLIIGIMVTGCTSKGKKDSQDNAKVTSTTSTISYDVKQEFKQDPIKMESIKIEKEFQVSDVEQREDKLIIKTEVDTSDPKEAYEIGMVLKNSMEGLNKEKITKDEIKNLEILLIGKERSWLYDGNDSIKEVEIK
jgi:hypothetical protein